MLAPIKPGLVPALDAVTDKTRAKRVLRTLHTGRLAGFEHELARALSDAVERVGRIHSVSIRVLEPQDAVMLAVVFDGAWEASIRGHLAGGDAAARPGVLQHRGRSAGLGKPRRLPPAHVGLPCAGKRDHGFTQQEDVMHMEDETAAVARQPGWRAQHAPQPAPAAPRWQATPFQLFDILDVGVLLIDAQDRLVHANPAARMLCEDGGPLSFSDGRLQCGVLVQTRVEAALLAARRGQWSMLSLRRRGHPLAVAVVPLGSTADVGAATTALLLGGDGRPSRLALQFFKLNHGLTPAEAAVLDALCAGLRPVQIATTGGVAVCTVRSQISAVRSKTGARSVSDLLRMVSGLPPVARHATQPSA